jgi:hypothetical protein
MSAIAEESPLFEAVTRKRLVGECNRLFVIMICEVE